ncbi:MAG: hypothetical protein K2X99_03085 [Gemmatimonadaceae bacterium]|nr:hypothetical protein [Gemmatimonadaceae bacterium]
MTGAVNGADPRHERIAALGAAVVVAVIALRALGADPVGLFWDDAVYLGSAKALATGAGYRITQLPDAPPAVHYPPLFPALLATMWRLWPQFPENLALLQLLNPILLAGAAGSAVLLGVRRFALAPVSAAVAVVVASSLSPILVIATHLFSEPLAMVLTIGALLVAERAVGPDARRFDAVAAGTLIALALLTRSAALPLFISFMCVALLRRAWRPALIGAVLVLVPLAVWQWWVARHAGVLGPELIGAYGPYAQWVASAMAADQGFLAATVAKNAAILGRVGGVLFAPLMPPFAKSVAAAAVGATLLAGMWTARRTAPVTVLTALGSLALVLVWPGEPERFLFALWPVFVLLLAHATMRAIAAERRAHAGARLPWLGRRAVVVATLLLGVGHAIYVGRGLLRESYRAPVGPLRDKYLPLVLWARAQADLPLIASDAAPMLSLALDRPVVPTSSLGADEYLTAKSLPRVTAELTALLRRYRPALLLLSPGAQEQDAVDELPSSIRALPLATLENGTALWRLEYAR